MESTSIEFTSEGSRVRGRFFPALRTAPKATLLLVPGWPGNPDDVMGLGSLLPQQGVSVCMFNPRGLHRSEGTHSHAGTLQDIGAALRWLRQPDVRERFEFDPAGIAIGGHCYGGGMTLAFAARDSSVRRVVTIAGNDHGEFMREMERDPAFAAGIMKMLQGTRAPDGPARFDPESGCRELLAHPEVYGLRENAAGLADRSILIFGGWEDAQVTVDQYLLPFYRALRQASAADVTFITYHTDHDFANVRERLATDIAGWLLRS